jgi:hypothetical protein
MKMINKILRQTKYRKLVLYPPALLYIICTTILYIIFICDIKHGNISYVYNTGLISSIWLLIGTILIYLSDVCDGHKTR